MELKLITTVGTSIFTNYQQTYLNEEKSIDNALDKLKNLRAKQLNWKNPYVINLVGDDEDWGIQEKFFKGYVIKDEEKWKEINDKNTLNNYASAEIFSIIKIYEKYKQNNEYIKIKVHLLSSDTVLSILAAKLIKEWFELAKEINNEKYKNIEIVFNDNVNSPNADYIENLRTDLDEEKIFDGFNNLISKILELSKNNEENTIINITGGYKGFIPILTIVAQLENLKLNYIYEDSEKLIEIFNFPIDFDYIYIETVKPFLKKYFLTEDRYLGKILKIIKNNKKNIYYSTEQSKFSINNKEIQAILDNINKEKHKLSNLLLNYHLIDFKDNNISPSIIGKMILDKSIEGTKGYVAELLFHKFFSSKANCDNDLLKEYSLHPNVFLQHKYYSIKNEKILLFTEKQENTKKIGDIDIILKKNNNILVIGEIKAFSTACDYRKYINTNKDYYYQIKARLLSILTNQNFNKLEFAFFVYKPVVKGLNYDEQFTSSQYFVDIVNRLNQLVEDPDLNNTVLFKCYGIKIPIKIKNENIDYTDFYKGNFKEWNVKEYK